MGEQQWLFGWGGAECTVTDRDRVGVRWGAVLAVREGLDKLLLDPSLDLQFTHQPHKHPAVLSKLWKVLLHQPSEPAAGAGWEPGPSSCV